MSNGILSPEQIGELHRVGARAASSLMEEAANRAAKEPRFFPHGITRLRFAARVDVGEDVQFSLEVEVEGPSTSSGPANLLPGDARWLQLTPTAIYGLVLKPADETRLSVVTIGTDDGYEHNGVTWEDGREHWFVAEGVQDLKQELDEATDLDFEVTYNPASVDAQFKQDADQIHQGSHARLSALLYPSSADWKTTPTLSEGTDVVFGVVAEGAIDTSKPCFAFRADSSNGENLGRVIALHDTGKTNWHTGSSYSLSKIEDFDLLSSLKRYTAER